MEERWHVLAGMSCSPFVQFTERYVENHHNTIRDGRTLDFILPLEQANQLISRLEHLQNNHGNEFIVEINGLYLDIVELRNLCLLHEKKDNKYKGTQESKWLRKSSNGHKQSTGTPVVDSTLASRCLACCKMQVKGIFGKICH